MKKKISIALSLLMAFALWTIAISTIDVQAIGPNGSSVGFATVNGAFHTLTGVHMPLYILTDWLGLVPVAFGFGFAVLGLTQWLRRKRLFAVDRNLLVLGGFYIVVLAVYLLFEAYIVNYRPVLIDGYLEASYPSSTTLLVMSVMPTAMLQLYIRLKTPILRKLVMVLMTAFLGFMVIGRLICGVHWLTDIIGSGLLSGGLVMLYHAIAKTDL